MKSKLSVLVLLFLFTALSLCIAGIFSPTGLTQKRISASTKSVSPNERMQRVENDLLMPFSVKGEPKLMLKLAERMQFYKVSGVNVTVINNGKIEWAKGFGISLEGTRPR